mgnify:CR=1 FL=1
MLKPVIVQHLEILAIIYDVSGSEHMALMAGEQIFDRETAVKVYRSFAVESGDVNPDVSYLPANCDGSLLNLPCYTANGVCAMPQVPNPPDDPQQPYPNHQNPESHGFSNRLQMRVA